MAKQLNLTSVILLCIVVMLSMACTSGFCRPQSTLKPEPQVSPLTDATNSKTASSQAAAMAGDNKAKESKSKEQLTSMSANALVTIYKYDGSQQCGMEKGKSPEDMEKELKGLKVINRAKRSDGKMRIQVCGQPTGQVNTFEIFYKDLPTAEKKGFKKWDLE